MLAKGLHLFYGVDMSAVGAIDVFANLWFNIGTAPPLLTAIATKMIEILQRYFHRVTEEPSRGNSQEPEYISFQRSSTCLG